MKKITLFIGLILGCVILVSCGITEELEQSKKAVTELKTVLKEQEKDLDSFDLLVGNIIPTFKEDLETKAETGLFQTESGLLYENFTARQDLATEIAKRQKKIKSIKKELTRIIDKKAVDVDHQQLKLIVQSLTIILNNSDSFDLYATTGFEQEKELYDTLPVPNLEKQYNLIQRTYGSISLVTEETFGNIEYSISLIEQYLENTQQPKN